MNAQQERRHFLTTKLAGFSYWDGAIVFSELHIGTELRMEREVDNKFDPYAVALYYGENKLGFIPRDENKEISKFLEQGWTEMFDVRINRVAPEQHPEQQIGIIIYIKLNPEMEE